MKTLILGLGNPILGDDAVGIKIAEELKNKIHDENIKVEQAVMCGGLSILDLIQGYDRVVVVDSIQTDGLSPGKIHRLELSDLKNTVHLSWPHEINFATAIELGKKLLIHLPTIIDIYAIEIKKSITFSEECSAEISKAIPGIVEEILAHQSRIH